MFQVGLSFPKEEKKPTDQKGNKLIDIFFYIEIYNSYVVKDYLKVKFRHAEKKHFFYKRRKSLRFKSLLEINEKIIKYKIGKEHK